MLYLNNLENNVYIDEDDVYLSNTIIQIECALEYFDQLVNEYEYVSNEALNLKDLKEKAKQVGSKIKKGISTVLSWSINILKSALNLNEHAMPRINDGIRKVSDKFSKSIKFQDRSATNKANGQYVYLLKVLSEWISDLDDVRNAFSKHHGENSGLELNDSAFSVYSRITKKYKDEWKATYNDKRLINGKHKSACGFNVPDFNHALILRKMTSDTLKFFESLKGLDSNIARAKFKSWVEADTCPVGWAIASEIRYKLKNFPPEEVMKFMTNMLTSLLRHEVAAYTIWLKYALKTENLIYKNETGRMGKSSAGIFKLYRFPKNVNKAFTAYMQKNYKKFKKYKWNKRLHMLGLIVTSLGEYRIRKGHYGTNSGSHFTNNTAQCISVSADVIINGTIKNIVLTITHELSHASDREHVHRTGDREKMLDHSSTDEEYENNYSNSPEEVYADSNAVRFVEDLCNGRISESNPVYIWIKHIVADIKAIAKRKGYTSTWGDKEKAAYDKTTSSALSRFGSNAKENEDRKNRILSKFKRNN